MAGIGWGVGIIKVFSPCFASGVAAGFWYSVSIAQQSAPRQSRSLSLCFFFVFQTREKAKRSAHSYGNGERFRTCRGIVITTQEIQIDMA